MSEPGRPCRSSFRITLICGAAPLLCGISIFLLWLIVRWDWLMMAGLVTVCAGTVLVLIGALALIQYHWGAPRDLGQSRMRRLLVEFGCAVLLLVNFPVAGGIMAAAVAIETAYTVTVHIETPQPLENVRVLGGGCSEEFGTIPPGGVARRSFWIQQDGSLKIQSSDGSLMRTRTIAGYVTPNLSSRAIVTFEGDGQVSVVHPELQ